MGKITLAKVIGGLESPADDWHVPERPRPEPCVPGITIHHYDTVVDRSEINAESSPANPSAPSIPATHSHAQQTLFALRRQAAAPSNERDQSLSCN